MIKPVSDSIDYLEFQCDSCNTRFHHAERISEDGPSFSDEQKYDVRNWIIMRIHLKCPNPKCQETDSLKLALK
jgi:hypothetical protein